MDVVVAGGHGKIGLRLLRLLAERGHRARGLVRNTDHVQGLADVGAEAVLCDMEELSDLSGCCSGADAVVFAAGAGPGSGVARKETVDRAAAVLLADAARIAGVRRYLLVSSAGVDEPPTPDRGEVWAAYITAKKAAEEAIRAADHLDWTVLRPGSLTDDPGVGKVLLAPPPVAHGSVTRDDTAAVLVALLDAPGSAGKVLELREGDVDVLESVAGVS
jgi:uncharacterized protein YbjT (DUF2867 family)